MMKIAIPILLSLALSGAAFGAKLTSAKITQVVRDVKVVDGESAKAAAVGDAVRGTTAVATGRLSRAELEFNDQTLLRLGSNTTFSLAAASRTVDLKSGSVLLQTHPGSGGVDIRAGSVTAAITGSLGFFSVSEPTDPRLKGKELVVKLISIHGGIAFEADGNTYELEPFQILVARIDLEGNLIGVPEIQTLDGEKLLASSRLVNGFPGNQKLEPEEILANLHLQMQEKERNEWTKVARNPADPLIKRNQRQTVGVNALIRRFLPKPSPPAPMATPVTRPPKKVVNFFPKPKKKNKPKNKPKNRPKSKPKPRPKPKPNPTPNPDIPTTGPSTDTYPGSGSIPIGKPGT